MRDAAFSDPAQTIIIVPASRGVRVQAADPSNRQVAAWLDRSGVGTLTFSAPAAAVRAVGRAAEQLPLPEQLRARKKRSVSEAATQEAVGRAETVIAEPQVTRRAEHFGVGDLNDENDTRSDLRERHHA